MSVSEISHLCLYVILSVSEISHDQSEKYMLVSSSVGFFTAFRMTCKEKYVILSVSEISHRTIALPSLDLCQNLK